jgi:hypothetical protein
MKIFIRPPCYSLQLYKSEFNKKYVLVMVYYRSSLDDSTRVHASAILVFFILGNLKNWVTSGFTGRAQLHWVGLLGDLEIYQFGMEFNGILLYDILWKLITWFKRRQDTHTHTHTQPDIEISSSFLICFRRQSRLKETSLLMCHTSEQFIVDLPRSLLYVYV